MQEFDMRPPAAAAPAAAPAADIDTLVMPVMQHALRRLTPPEVQELEAAITPRMRLLLTKAFGPEFGAALAPLTADDAPDPESEAAIKELMRDPRYWRDRDPDIVARVREGFETLYPG